MHRLGAEILLLFLAAVNGASIYENCSLQKTAFTNSLSLEITDNKPTSFNVLIASNKTFKNLPANFFYQLNSPSNNCSSLESKANFTLQKSYNGNHLHFELKNLDPNNSYILCAKIEDVCSCECGYTTIIGENTTLSPSDLHIDNFESDSTIIKWQPPVSFTNIEGLEYSVEFVCSNNTESTTTTEVPEATSDNSVSADDNTESTTTEKIPEATITSDNPMLPYDPRDLVNNSCNGFISSRKTIELGHNSVENITVCVLYKSKLYEEGCQTINASENDSQSFTLDKHNDSTYNLTTFPEDSVKLNQTNFEIFCDETICCNSCDGSNLPKYDEDLQTITIPAEAIDAVYKARLFLIDTEDLLDVKTFYSKQSKDVGMSMTTTTDSVIFNWKRPVNTTELQNIYINLGNASWAKDINYTNFVGCNLTTTIDGLLSYSKYESEYKVGKYVKGRLYTDDSHKENITTRASDCGPILNFEAKEQDSMTKSLNIVWPDQKQLIEKISDVRITFSYGGTQKIFSNDDACITKRNCTIENIEKHPDMEYSIEIECKNEGSDKFGPKNKETFKFIARVPNLKNEESLELINTTKRYDDYIKTSINKEYDSLQFKVNTWKLDREAGNIINMTAYYGPIENLNCSQAGRIEDFSDFTQQVQETSISSPFDQNEIYFILNLHYSSSYEICVRYMNTAGYAFTTKSKFRTPENPVGRTITRYLIFPIFVLLWMYTIFISRKEKKSFSVAPLVDLPSTSPFYEQEECHCPIDKANSNVVIDQLLKEPRIDLKREYFSLGQRIRGPSCPETLIGAKSCHKKRNRYSDIIPYDFSRVILEETEDEEDSDGYINASYIHGYKVPCGFIASQGPLNSTVYDFWRMILEQNVEYIVMLTSCVENQLNKCLKYWPSSATLPNCSYGDINIRLLVESVEEADDYIIRKFSVSKGWQMHEVIQFQCTWWKDKKCPEVGKLLTFIREIKNRELSPHSPMVVHCSAGVGRTGVFIALYNLMDEIEDHGVDSVDIYYQVLNLRYFRTCMVQTQHQYYFLYECVKNLLLSNPTLAPSSNNKRSLTNGDSVGCDNSDQLEDYDLEPISDEEMDEDEEREETEEIEEIEDIEDIEEIEEIEENEEMKRKD